MPYGGTTPDQDKKIERCIKRVLSNPDFKPQDEKQTKEQAAIAICKSAIMKADIDFKDNLFLDMTEAAKKAKELGCHSSHTMELMGDTYFMPCSTHKELQEVLLQQNKEDIKMEENITEFKMWSTKEVNDLPDSSFLYIEGGGKKDSGGKTIPRSLRHLPYKDANGKIDLPHLRNAIARIPQMKGISDSLKKELQDKARKLLDSVKGENKMVENKENIATFSDESVIKKVEEIIKRLEEAQTIEDAKGLVPELRMLIPVEPAEAPKEEKPAEEKAVEEKPIEEVKAEEKPAEEPKAEEKSEAEKVLEEVKKEAVEEPKPVVEEQPVAEKAEAKEAKESVKENASLSEVLDLNDKLIIKLKESLDENTKLESEIAKYKEQISELSGTISKYKEVEEKEKEDKRLSKFNEVFENYINFFKVDKKDVDVIKGQMSTFSEDVLEQINSYMDKKKIAEMKAEPDVVTQPSSQLPESKETEKEKIYWDDLTPKEKTRFLFERVKELNE